MMSPSVNVDVNDDGVEFSLADFTTRVPFANNFVDFGGLLRAMKQGGAKDHYLDALKEVVANTPDLCQPVVLVTALEQSFNVDVSISSMAEEEEEEELNPALKKAISKFNQTCDDIAIFGATCSNKEATRLFLERCAKEMVSEATASKEMASHELQVTDVNKEVAHIEKMCLDPDVNEDQLLQYGKEKGQMVKNQRLQAVKAHFVLGCWVKFFFHLIRHENGSIQQPKQEPERALKVQRNQEIHQL